MNGMMNARERLAQLEARLLEVAPNDFQGIIEILKQFRKDVLIAPPPVPEVVEGLRDIAKACDWKWGEQWVLMSQVLQSPELIEPLCAILDLGHPEAPNENIIEFLIDMKSSVSVQHLIKVVDSRYDFDFGLQLSLKSLEALCEIGTPEAMDYVKGVMFSGDPMLSERAEILLDSPPSSRGQLGG
jgi:hypothetical protein